MSAIAEQLSPPDLLRRFTPTDHREELGQEGGTWTVESNDPGIAVVVKSVSGRVNVAFDLSLSLVKEEGRGCCAEVLVIADANVSFVGKGQSCVMAYDRALRKVLGFYTDDISDEALAELLTMLLSAGKESMVVEK